MAMAVLDKMAAIRLAIVKMHSLSVQMKALKDDHDKLQKEVVQVLGINGVLEFNNYRCKVVQSLRRNVPWKELAYGLAKKLFPERASYVKWLRSIARKYKKAATAPFAKITILKDKE